jgi:predicted MPP superfamily phosphohydrolase
MLKKTFRVTSRIVLAGMIVGLLLLLYTYLEPYRLVIKEVSLNVPNWSNSLNGFKIVAVSDIHGGSHTITEERIRSIVEQILILSSFWAILFRRFTTMFRLKAAI